MSTYRIYVDSRDRKDGTPESLEFQLPYSLAIREKSLANIDVVVVPNSIQTVIPGVNDSVHVRETSNLDQVWFRTPRLNPGYYSIESLKLNLKGHSTTAPTCLGRTQSLTMSGSPGGNLVIRPSVLVFLSKSSVVNKCCLILQIQPHT